MEKRNKVSALFIVLLAMVGCTSGNGSGATAFTQPGPVIDSVKKQNIDYSIKGTDVLQINFAQIFYPSNYVKEEHTTLIISVSNDVPPSSNVTQAIYQSVPVQTVVVDHSSVNGDCGAFIKGVNIPGSTIRRAAEQIGIQAGDPVYVSWAFWTFDGKKIGNEGSVSIHDVIKESMTNSYYYNSSYKSWIDIERESTLKRLQKDIADETLKGTEKVRKKLKECLIDGNWAQEYSSGGYSAGYMAPEWFDWVAQDISWYRPVSD